MQEIIEIAKDKLPGYDEKIKMFYEEHIHEDEEIRYILDGTGRDFAMPCYAMACYAMLCHSTPCPIWSKATDSLREGSCLRWPQPFCTAGVYVCYGMSARCSVLASSSK